MIRFEPLQITSPSHRMPSTVTSPHPQRKQPTIYPQFSGRTPTNLKITENRKNSEVYGVATLQNTPRGPKFDTAFEHPTPLKKPTKIPPLKIPLADHNQRNETSNLNGGCLETWKTPKSTLRHKNNAKESNILPEIFNGQRHLLPKHSLPHLLKEALQEDLSVNNNSCEAKTRSSSKHPSATSNQTAQTVSTNYPSHSNFNCTTSNSHGILPQTLHSISDEVIGDAGAGQRTLKKAASFKFKTRKTIPGEDPLLEVVESAQTTREHYNTPYHRNPHLPARFIQIDHPSTTHRFSSDALFYEHHTPASPNRHEERIMKYQNHMNSPVEDYKQKINSDFQNRFGSQNYLDGQANSLECLDDYVESSPYPSRFYNSPRSHKSINFGQSPTSFQSLGNQTQANLLLNATRKCQRPVVVGLPNRATMKIPEIPHRRTFVRKDQKKKTNYDPFSQQKLNSSTETDKEEAALRDLIAFQPKMGAILPPQNPLFRVQGKGSAIQDIIVGGQKSMRLIRPQRKNFRYVRVKLIEVLRYMKLLKLKPKDLLEHQIFSSRPYEKKHSEELITACKIGDQETVTNLLNKNKFLVYDYDNAHLTSLHWAVKRNHVNIAKMLIDTGADVNAGDLIGRTPLYFALKYNHIEMIKLLLFSQCDPWSTEECNYQELTADKPLARYLLSKCRQLHIVIKMTPPHLRDTVWEKESLNLILAQQSSLTLRQYEN